MPWALVGIAAIILAACTRREDSPSPSSSSAPPSSGKSPPPPSSSAFSGEQDSQAQWLKLQLQNRGVSTTDLDRGCKLFEYKKDGTWIEKVTPRGDGIQDCESYEYVLEQEERFGDLADEIAGKPFPWSLDDRDPTTDFDEKIRKRVSDWIAYLDSFLEKKGYAKGSVEYQERMVAGLYYLVALPAKILATPKGPKSETRRQVEAHLQSLGMTEVQKKLFATGGLRVEGDYTREYRALDALKTGKGECTEHSKILYAVLKMAGLQPCFVLIDPKQEDHPKIKDFIRENPFYFHICIGLDLGGKKLFLDSALYEWNPSYRLPQELTLRQYLSLDQSVEGMMAFEQKKYSEAKKLLEKALRVDPQNFLALQDLAHLSFSQKNWAETERYAKASIQIRPNSLAFNNLAATYEARGELNAALEAMNEAIRLNPNFAMLYRNRAMIWTRKGERERGFSDHAQALRLNRKLEKLYEQEWKEHSTKTWNSSEKGAARMMMEMQTGVDPMTVETETEMAGLLWAAGYQSDAEKRMLQLFERLKKDTAYSPALQTYLLSLFSILPRELLEKPSLHKERKALGL